MRPTLPAWQEQSAQGIDAWSRAARRLSTLAVTRQRPLDLETLVLSDVRDLQALASRMRDEDTASSLWMRLRRRTHRFARVRASTRSGSVEERR